MTRKREPVGAMTLGDVLLRAKVNEDLLEMTAILVEDLWTRLVKKPSPKEASDVALLKDVFTKFCVLRYSRSQKMAVKKGRKK